jgi:cation diffusion facilitator family transporter
MKPSGSPSMDHCCNDKAPALDALGARQAATLRWVLALNAAMFGVELAAGLFAGSTALLADSLDMFGDALVYAFSLYVVGRGALWKARAAMAKAAAMGLFGVFVLVELVIKLLTPHIPVATTMGAVGILAFAVNVLCFVLLWRHRREDINMRSVWLCSQNDILANAAVLLAAAGVGFTRTRWPDLIVGALLCIAFLWSAIQVARETRAVLRKAAAQGSRWMDGSEHDDHLDHLRSSSL